MIDDPDTLRDRIIAFDVRRGPYDRRLHPLYLFMKWCEQDQRLDQYRAEMFAGRIRQILVHHSIPELLRAADPDVVIDDAVINGVSGRSRGADRTTLRRAVKLLQQYNEAGGQEP